MTTCTVTELRFREDYQMDMSDAQYRSVEAVTLAARQTGGTRTHTAPEGHSYEPGNYTATFIRQGANVEVRTGHGYFIIVVRPDGSLYHKVTR